VPTPPTTRPQKSLPSPAESPSNKPCGAGALARVRPRKASVIPSELDGPCISTPPVNMRAVSALVRTRESVSERDFVIPSAARDLQLIQTTRDATLTTKRCPILPHSLRKGGKRESKQAHRSHSRQSMLYAALALISSFTRALAPKRSAYKSNRATLNVDSFPRINSLTRGCCICRMRSRSRALYRRRFTNSKIF
jgi:hypothetical protein